MNLFILIFCIKQIRICWFCIWIKVRATGNIWKSDLTRWFYWSISIFFNSFTDNKNQQKSTWYTTYNTKVIKIFWALHYRGIHEAVIFWYHIKFNIFMFIAVWSCVWWKKLSKQKPSQSPSCRRTLHPPFVITPQLVCQIKKEILIH